MKKLALIVMGLFLSGTVLAEQSIRIINNDKFAGMKIQTQTCKTADGRKLDCVDNKPIYLPSLHEEETTKQLHYTDVTIPDSRYPHYFMLTIKTVSAIDSTSGKIVATGQYSSKGCAGYRSSDIIVLDPYGTNVVACNDHNQGTVNVQN